MKKPFPILVLLILLSCQSKTELTGPQLVEKSIAYHDPKNSWKDFQGQWQVRLQFPNKSERTTNISLDKIGGIFTLEDLRESGPILRYMDADTNYHLINKQVVVHEDSIKKYGLTEDRTRLMKNYYSYLYGLPMKLKDEGTRINELVEMVNFQDEDYLRVKVTYEEEVGSDTWYFYFDPQTYAMKLYQFYHEEEKNDGEYILLDGEISYRDMRIPKDRSWYTNDSSRLLGIDYLVEIRDLQ